MARTCPDGHSTTSDDYCDVCGMAMGEALAAVPSAPAPAAPSNTQECPNCAAGNPADALFCEACGYDYTTGTMPRPIETLLSLPVPGPSGAAESEPEPVQAGEPAAEPAVPPASTSPAAEHTAPALLEPWVAEVWIDPDWYQAQGSTDPMPSPGLPTVVALRHTSSLIGRASRSRGIFPDLDISGDPGVSRRHAQLTTDGSRWFVEDLGSANGTYLGAASTGLPKTALPGSQKREIASGDQVYLGAWTRLVVRRAAEGEV